MQKLTLSIDPDVVRRAKRLAARRRTSVSKLVARYLDAVSRVPADTDEPPVLRRLRGALRRARPEDWGDHLAAKHR